MKFLLLAVTVLLIGGSLTIAQQSPEPPASSSRAHKPAANLKLAGPDSGVTLEGVYRNAFFGFRYKIPYGWVERTADMRESDQPGKSMLLLAAFERPPEAAGDSVNSAVIITAESVSSYPGLKTGADYFGPLTELTTSKGFKVTNEPYEFPLGARQLVRGDFSKTLGTLTMQQASLVLLEKSYVVSFTFITGTDDETSLLIEGLSFGPPQTTVKPSDKK